ncbi:peptidase inhibitor family I36 protein [Lentzea sp. NPDC058436]|uniref:peptidase inhibitor family I36 protein n=1 Tax=Lentzea sp. NPDC058436 TaxID=3346499 RepID=UPI00365BFE99
MTSKIARLAAAGLAALGLMAVVPSTAGAVESGVLATYNGNTIDLAQGWEGATVCAQTDGGVHCYDDDAAYRTATNLPASQDGGLGTASVDDCPPLWKCLWDNRNYSGRRLQWRDPGDFGLAQYGFRNRANSAANRKVQGGFHLWDVDPVWDKVIHVPGSSGIPDLGAYPSGNWNNKVDAVVVR